MQRMWSGYWIRQDGGLDVVQKDDGTATGGGLLCCS
jgi:hypothetical protein